MAVNVAGALSVAVFFFGMLATGLWASWKERKRGKNTAESVVLAGRNIGVVLGTITLLGKSLRFLPSNERDVPDFENWRFL